MKRYWQKYIHYHTSVILHFYYLWRIPMDRDLHIKSRQFIVVMDGLASHFNCHEIHHFQRERDQWLFFDEFCLY